MCKIVEKWTPSAYEYRAPSEKLHQASDGDDAGAAAGVTGKPAGANGEAAAWALEGTVGEAQA